MIMTEIFPCTSNQVKFFHSSVACELSWFLYYELLLLGQLLTIYYIAGPEFLWSFSINSRKNSFLLWCLYALYSCLAEVWCFVQLIISSILIVIKKTPIPTTPKKWWLIYFFVGPFVISFFILLTFNSFLREYGEFLVRCGLIGEAVKVFEDLELWDNLIFCYRYVDTWEEFEFIFYISIFLLPLLVEKKSYFIWCPICLNLFVEKKSYLIWDNLMSYFICLTECWRRKQLRWNS